MRYPRKLLFLLIVALSAVSFGQQGAATGPALVGTNIPPDTAYLRRPYRWQLTAQGGIEPYKWFLASGNLPKGLELAPDGLLTGVPTEIGTFSFTVTITDGGKPGQQVNQTLVLRVIAPLFAQWGRVPRVNGRRIEGSVKLSNQTGQDFDLTLIVLAVAENGRATTIGYQRFTLKKETADQEIPFGENLASGTYEVNLDAVGEVASANTIYRARLVVGGLQVVEGP